MRLTVATYNVHRFFGTDGRHDVPRVADVVRALGADVVALQEVAFAPGSEAPGELLEALPGYQVVSAPISRVDGARHGNVVLTRLPISKSRRICLDFERREPRTAVEVELETGATPLRVIATHLGLEPSERRFQVRLILDRVSDDERCITVLLGDFNEWFLIGRPLRWLHRRFGRSRYVRTFPSWAPLFALDRVCVHPPRALVHCGAHDTPLSRRASDHLPVVAELDV
jgi:endonuclease/exonuclease/phosphatase family metal-dependent hydrolase